MGGPGRSIQRVLDPRVASHAMQGPDHPGPGVGRAMIAKRLAAWAALSLVTLGSAPVFADADADLQRGLARFEAGEFAAAIGPLEAAHAADPSDLDTICCSGSRTTAAMIRRAHGRCSRSPRSRRIPRP